MRYILLFMFILQSHILFAQCGNVGFENGDNTGWCGYSGTANLGPTSPAGSLPTYTFVGGCTPWTTPQYYTAFNTDVFPNAWDTAWKIMSVSDGFDPYVPAIPVVSPWGQSHSIRLGSTIAGGHAERLRFTYPVTAQNANFVYQYAVVLDNDGGHESYEQPTFRIRVTTSSGALINPTCGQYNIYAGQGGVGFNTITGPDNHDISYRNWTLSSLDLTPYIGQNVFIEFTVGDCVYSAHYGYAYIDCSCIPLTLATNYCSGSATADVTAPDGYINYSWTADAAVNYPPVTGAIVPVGNVLATTQTLQVASDDTTTTYTVDLIPYQGMLCATQLNYIFNPIPTLDADFTHTAYCGNTPSEFTETSVVMNNGQPPTDWFWDFGDGDTAVIQNPLHNYPVLDHDTTYEVMLIVYAGTSCKDTITHMVFVPAGLDIDTTGIYGFANVKCHGENNGSAQIKVSGSPGASYLYNWIIPPTASTLPVSNDVYMAYGLMPNAITSPPIPEYWLKITDTVNGCKDSVSFVITEPTLLTAEIDTNYITCALGSGSLTAVVNGGTPPYNIAWTTPTPQVGLVANNIPAGNYSINVIDNNLCHTAANGVLIDGSELHYDLATTDVTCHGFADGSASIHLYGGKPPYLIIWNINNQALTPLIQADDTINSLPKFTNFVVIGNANGCLPDTIPFTINEPDTISTIITSSSTACKVAQNGAIKVDVVGGTQPYSYFWAETLKNTKGMNDVMEGTYHVTITDANNCVFDTLGVIGYDSDLVVTAVPNFVYDSASTNQLWVTVDKKHDYTYKWSNGEYLLDEDSKQSPRLKEMFFPQDFRVDVIDQYGCTGFDSVFVDVTPNIFAPSAFTPNGDKINDTLTIEFSNYRISEFEIRIYDRWGNVVFQSNDPKFKWDGHDTNIGTYNFNISYVDNRKKRQSKNGIIALMR